MKSIYLLLSFYLLGVSCLAQNQQNFYFEVGEDVRLKQGRIWSAPTSQSSVIAQHDRDVEKANVIGGGIHNIFLAVESDSIINGYLKISYLDTTDAKITGWVYAKNLERKPVPHFMLSPSDTLTCLKYIKICDWKKYNDPEFYSTAVHAQLNTGLADAHYKSEHYIAAIAEYTEAISLSPNNYRRTKRAFSKGSVGDYIGAINDLNYVIATKRETWTEFSSPYTLGGQTFEYSDTDILNANTYYNLRINRFNTALSNANRSLIIDNKSNPKAYYFRAFCYLNLKLKSKACLDFSKAGEQGMSESYKAIQEYCSQ